MKFVGHPVNVVFKNKWKTTILTESDIKIINKNGMRRFVINESPQMILTITSIGLK